MFRKFHEFGLQTDYDNSLPDDPSSARRLFQQIAALAFVSVYQINDVWCQIMDKFEDIPNVQRFFDYFTDTWLDEDCLFPRNLWNYYDFNGPRTTNGLKGWHHRLNSNIDASNPNVYVVIEEL